MIDIINTCIMYRFYKYCKCIIIIVFLFILIKSYKSDLVKSVLWFSEECASPLRPKTWSNIAKLRYECSLNFF